jgi:hypothetical protein
MTRFYGDDKAVTASVEGDYEADFQKELAELQTTKPTDATTRKCRKIALDMECMTFITVPKDMPEDSATFTRRILLDLVEKQQTRTRFISRLIPVQAVCSARLEVIQQTLGDLVAANMALLTGNGEKINSYGIMFRHRWNDMHRDDTISALADSVHAKCPSLTVNLKNPDFAIIVEVLKVYIQL